MIDLQDFLLHPLNYSDKALVKRSRGLEPEGDDIGIAQAVYRFKLRALRELGFTSLEVKAYSRYELSELVDLVKQRRLLAERVNVPVNASFYEILVLEAKYLGRDEADSESGSDETRMVGETW